MVGKVVGVEGTGDGNNDDGVSDNDDEDEAFVRNPFGPGCVGVCWHA